MLQFNTIFRVITDICHSCVSLIILYTVTKAQALNLFSLFLLNPQHREIMLAQVLLDGLYFFE